MGESRHPWWPFDLKARRSLIIYSNNYIVFLTNLQSQIYAEMQTDIFRESVKAFTFLRLMKMLALMFLP